MSDYHAMSAMLSDYIRAGVPLVVIRTAERHRVERALRDIVRALNIRAFCYTDSKQVESLSPQDGDVAFAAIRERHAPPAVQHLVHLGGEARDLTIAPPRERGEQDTAHDPDGSGPCGGDRTRHDPCGYGERCRGKRHHRKLQREQAVAEKPAHRREARRNRRRKARRRFSHHR